MYSTFSNEAFYTAKRVIFSLSVVLRCPTFRYMKNCRRVNNRLIGSIRICIFFFKKPFGISSNLFGGHVQLNCCITLFYRTRCALQTLALRYYSTRSARSVGSYYKFIRHPTLEKVPKRRRLRVCG